MKALQSLIGRKFNKLTIISQEESIGYSKRWLCRCDCGQEKIVYQGALVAGATKSCGCYNKEQSKKRFSRGWSNILTKEFLQKEHICNKKSLREIAKGKGCSVSCVIKYMQKHELKSNESLDDLVGKKFEMLTVLSFSHGNENASFWNVQCDCGNLKTVRRSSLVRHTQISCGCYNKNKNWEGCGNLSKSYWTKIVKSAIKRNLEFDISMEYAWDLFQKQKEICVFSGIPIVMDRQFSKNGVLNKKQTASLDRIDSTKGYIKGNVQWIHLILNRMKSNLSDFEFIEWCNKVSNHNKKI